MLAVPVTERVPSLGAGPARRVRAGQLLYRVGDEARSLFLVKSGLIKASVTSERGDEVTLRVAGPGEMLGALCWCWRERREHATVLEAGDVVEILLTDLLAQLERSPHAMVDFVAAVCRELGDAYEKLGSWSFDSAAVRLVRTLIRMGRDLGEAAGDDTRIPHYIKQEELAHLVGARREVVSTLLNRLRERGLVSYTRKGRLRLDLPGLERHLGALTPLVHASARASPGASSGTPRDLPAVLPTVRGKIPGRNARPRPSGRPRCRRGSTEDGAATPAAV